MDPDRRRLLLGGFAAAGGLVRPAAAQTLVAPDAAERAAMDAAVGTFMATHDVPGFGAAIVRGDRIVWQGAYGLADRSAGEALTTAHRFRIASISKPVTATALFRLFEAGALSPDMAVFGPAGALGPAGAGVAADSPLRAVTIDHLLTHTAGAWPNDAGDPMMQHPAMDHARLIAWTLANRRVMSTPGTAFSYSNFGYCLLGRIIEHATGKPYEAFVRESVLAPAGAGGMAIAGNTRGERLANEVRYHPTGRDDPYAYNVRRMDSHGGWVATPAEVALFVAGAARRTRPPLLSEASVTAMTRPTEANPRYARGWSINAAGNRWHTGSLGGTATIAVWTRSGLSWAGLLNTRDRTTAMTADLDRLMWTLARAVPAWRA